MTAPAITLEVLPAGCGDCLLLSCPVGPHTWRLLVDTGPDETYPHLRDRLARLPPDSKGQRQIDLAIISHIDHDHIGGAGLLLNEPSLGLTFGDIWFNAPSNPPCGAWPRANRWPGCSAPEMSPCPGQGLRGQGGGHRARWRVRGGRRMTGERQIENLQRHMAPQLPPETFVYR